MYRCEICKTVCPAGQPRIVHTIYRTLQANYHEVRDCRGRVVEKILLPVRKQIAAEIPVCSVCKAALELGIGLPQLKEEVAQTVQVQEVQEATVAPVPQKKPPAKRSLGTPVPKTSTGAKPWSNGKAVKPHRAGKPKGVKQPGQRKSKKSSGSH